MFLKTLFTQHAEEGEGGVEEEWHPVSATPLPIEVRTLTVTSPAVVLVYGTTLTFYRTEFQRRLPEDKTRCYPYVYCSL